MLEGGIMFLLSLHSSFPSLLVQSHLLLMSWPHFGTPKDLFEWTRVRSVGLRTRDGEERSGVQKIFSYGAMQYTVVATLFPSNTTPK